jgi:GNAT superfamily N-acetyltransferase
VTSPASAPLRARPFRPADVDAVQGLYETVLWRRRRPLAEWRWRFLDAPAGPSEIVVLEDDDGDVVGHVANSPFPTWVDGRRLSAALGGDLMVAERYQGRGGMRLLFQALESSPRRFDLRLSFTSKMATPRIQRYGSRVLGTLPIWTHRLRPTRPLPGPARPLVRAGLRAVTPAGTRPRTGLVVEPLRAPGPELDGLAADSGAFVPCIRIRDAAYLRWRWLEQPGGHWTMRVARADDGSVRGVSVLGLESGPRGRAGSISDLLARDPAALRALLLDAVEALAPHGCGAVTFALLDPRPWARRTLIRAGFLPGDSGNAITCRSVSPAAGEAPERRESWYLTRGDTEPWPNTPFPAPLNQPGRGASPSAAA